MVSSVMEKVYQVEKAKKGERRKAKEGIQEPKVEVVEEVIEEQVQEEVKVEMKPATKKKGRPKKGESNGVKTSSKGK